MKKILLSLFAVAVLISCAKSDVTPTKADALVWSEETLGELVKIYPGSFANMID